MTNIQQRKTNELRRSLIYQIKHHYNEQLAIIDSYMDTLEEARCMTTNKRRVSYIDKLETELKSYISGTSELRSIYTERAATVTKSFDFSSKYIKPLDKIYEKIEAIISKCVFTQGVEQ